MTSFQLRAAAVAAVLITSPALAAQAPDPRPTTPSPPPSTTPPAQPGAQQAPQGTAQQTQPQQAQGQALSEGQKQALGTINWWWVYAMQAAAQVEQKGSSEQVKELARKVAREGNRLGPELQSLTAQRGVDWKTLPQPSEAQRMQQEVAALSSLSGEALDREFVGFYTRNGPTFVDALKHARDVTPGRDAQLKKYLDDAENLQEENLAAARQLKSQRQARTPPKQ
jgi:putative membrane protein